MAAHGVCRGRESCRGTLGPVFGSAGPVAVLRFMDSIWVWKALRCGAQ